MDNAPSQYASPVLQKQYNLLFADVCNIAARENIAIGELFWALMSVLDEFPLEKDDLSYVATVERAPKFRNELCEKHQQRGGSTLVFDEFLLDMCKDVFKVNLTPSARLFLGDLHEDITAD